MNASAEGSRGGRTASPERGASCWPAGRQGLGAHLAWRPGPLKGGSGQGYAIGTRHETSLSLGSRLRGNGEGLSATLSFWMSSFIHSPFTH